MFHRHVGVSNYPLDKNYIYVSKRKWEREHKRFSRDKKVLLHLTNESLTEASTCLYFTLSLPIQLWATIAAATAFVTVLTLFSPSVNCHSHTHTCTQCFSWSHDCSYFNKSLMNTEPLHKNEKKMCQKRSCLCKFCMVRARRLKIDPTLPFFSRYCRWCHCCCCFHLFFIANSMSYGSNSTVLSQPTLFSCKTFSDFSMRTMFIRTI